MHLPPQMHTDEHSERFDTKDHLFFHFVNNFGNNEWGGVNKKSINSNIKQEKIPKGKSQGTHNAYSCRCHQAPLQWEFSLVFP